MEIRDLMQDYNIMLLPLHNYNEIPAKVVKGWNSNIKKYGMRF